MTLNQWVKNGCPMLSDYAAGWCCKILGVPVKHLREMELDRIYSIPQAGEVAKREHDSWSKNAKQVPRSITVIELIRISGIIFF